MEDSYPNFLPQWTNALEHIYSKKYLGLIPVYMTNTGRRNGAEKKYGLDWTSSNCCLVGEAFFNRYTYTGRCSRCSELSVNRSLMVFDSLGELYKFKKELAEHLQNAHPDVWSEWKNKF